MFFLFYFLPLLVCITSSVLFFTGDKKNIAAGLMFILVGFVPLVNILASVFGFGNLVIKALRA